MLNDIDSVLFQTIWLHEQNPHVHLLVILFDDFHIQSSDPAGLTFGSVIY